MSVAQNGISVSRLRIVKLVALLLFVSMFLQLFELQITEGTKYENMAINNRQQSISIPSYRGEIYVNDGEKKIVENIPSFSIYLTPSGFPPKKSPLFEPTLQRIERELNVDRNTILQMLKLKKKWNPHRPYLCKQNIPFKTILQIAENLESYPGISYQETPIRKYPYGSLYSHITGYIQRISSERLYKNTKLGYHMESIVGVNGIEYQYDLEMRGREGKRVQVVDAKNRVQHEYIPQESASMPGYDLILTIDDRIQKIIKNTLDGLTGACVITRPHTGEILGLYSSPSYDPNIFIEGVDQESFDKIKNDPQKPFLNRVTQAVYAPGSIFKIIVSAAALKNGFSFLGGTFFCSGKNLVGLQIFKCEGAHGWQNMLQAMANSCNSYYYQMSINMGAIKIIKMSDEFSLGKKMMIDLPFEKPGRVPSHRWKSEQYGTFWWDGDTANLSIGQGYLLCTVLQMNAMIGAIANNGVTKKLHLLKKMIEVTSGSTIVTTEETEPIISLLLEEQSIKNIQKSLRQVVTIGTARKGANTSLAIAGKTGSSQNIQGEAHAWFVCYAPFTSIKPENKIALSLIIEHGGSGGGIAAPFATAIMEGIFYKTNPIDSVLRISKSWKRRNKIFSNWLKFRKIDPDHHYLPQENAPDLNSSVTTEESLESQELVPFE